MRPERKEGKVGFQPRADFIASFLQLSDGRNRSPPVFGSGPFTIAAMYRYNSSSQTGRAEKVAEDASGGLTDLRVKFGRFSFAVYIVWAVLLLALGSALPRIITAIFGE